MFGCDLISMSGQVSNPAYLEQFNHPNSNLQGAITAAMPAGSFGGDLINSSSTAGSGCSAASSRPPASTSARLSPVASLPDSPSDSARPLSPFTKQRSLARPSAAASSPPNSSLSRSLSCFNISFPLAAHTLRTALHSGCVGPFKPSRDSSLASSCLPSPNRRDGSWITAGRGRHFRSSPTSTPRETQRMSSFN
ncbi:RHTO0S09e04962g1_1 [Rhodotorula toruloides]|uniref:RHTO0S09e04962g1_1 n=1 Tax=Rhodotorula toruloides TaxID=5286 RepID=A0A061B3I2_RHOTO|nr:RHTO0S09e04962g1_1 [Rhodotorula toruloides]